MHVPHVGNSTNAADVNDIAAHRELWATDGYASALDEYVRRELAAIVELLLRSLPSKEEEVLRRRFGIGCDEHTLDETGAVMQNENAGRPGITRERIRQIEAKALRKLRHPSRSKWIVPFVEERAP